MKDFKIDSLFKTLIFVVAAVSPFQYIELDNNLCEGHLCSINQPVHKKLESQKHDHAKMF